MRLASLMLGIMAVICPNDGRGHGLAAVLIFLLTALLMGR
jgi:hypothetical protein